MLRQVKSEAALRGTSLKEWITEFVENSLAARAASVSVIASLLTACLFGVGCGRQQPPAPPAVTTFTEQEVTDFVTPGRSRDEVIRRFGEPGFSMTNGVSGVTLFYNLPLPNPAVRQTLSFAGFQVRLTNGVVAGWNAIRQDIR
jgi:hypothetical protein